MNQIQIQVPDGTRRKIFGLHPNVFLLGVVSFLTDVSSEMIFTLLPLFLNNVLGTRTAIVGWVGGISESTDALFRIVSGRISDKIGKRKLLATLGYSLSTAVKPLMLLAGTWGGVAGVRFGDRVGKGLRGASRDALLADSLAVNERGKGFGFHRAMDTGGAVLGLIITAAIIYLVQGGGTDLKLETYKWMVAVGTVPAILGVLVLVSLVRERKREKAAASIPGATRALAPPFDRRFILFLAVIAIFTLGNSSDFFVILRAQSIQTPLIEVVAMLVLHNAVYAFTAIPMGVLSDKLGRRRVIAGGWFIYALVYLGFALATDVWQIWMLFAAYGLYYGIVEGVARAFVADLVPVERRGTAYGYYQGVVGLMLLPASVLGGYLWDNVNPATTFYFGSGMALLAVLGILFLVRERTS
ncbi:MAG: MFS transporter [Dehalococcoidia bacterium]|nr:MFS transporter [Dehalococcoidia bacterium]